MVFDSNDNDSDSKESDFLSIAGEDVDVYLNHYRIPKLLNYGPSGTKNPPLGIGNREQVKYNHEGKIMSLTELAAQKVACHLPFGQVEHFNPPVPEPMQCRIAFWSFPQDEEDVRLYTCLANGNAEIFIRAEDLISLNCVCDMLQVGFHLSANVKFVQDSTEDLDCFRVAITFDRRRITSCSCSCNASTFWCQHTVAVCLQRIRKPQELTLRAPVSESLQRLEKNQLQKFAQYLINELPQQILPAAQKLLDELLSGDDAMINRNPAAPDPTAGATINEQTNWCLDDTHLSMDIQKILLKQCTSQPTVCSDISALHTSAPPAATEYSQLLRPIRGREPEGLWNLISIVGEMMKRRDSNYFLLLEIMTKEVLNCDKVVTWWFETKVSLHSGSTIHYTTNKNTTTNNNNNSSSSSSSSNNNNNNSQCTSQYSCSNFCDEIVHLWRLAAMDPDSNPSERKKLYKKFFSWHLSILKKHSSLLENQNINNNHQHQAKFTNNKRNLLELFPGFKPSMEGCLIQWNDWDDKRCCLISPSNDFDNDEKNTKLPSKTKKKKKKKSKGAKNQSNANNIIETKPSESKESTNDNNNDNSKEESKENDVAIDALRDEVPENQAEVNVENENPQQFDYPNLQEENIDDNNVVEPLQERQQQQQNVQLPQIEPELQVYFMERKLPGNSPHKLQKPESLEDSIKLNQKRLNDPLEIICAKAEGLYAHGYTEEGRKLAYKATTEILNNPNYPSLKQLCTIPRRKKKGLDNQMSIVASEALTKISFLCNVLLDEPEYHNLVFKLVLFGVEMKRMPAATKPLEVKLINQKHDLIMLLKSITLHEEELVLLREKAQILRDGLVDDNSNALTTIILGNYIFEALVLSKSPACNLPRQPIDGARSGSTGSYNQPVVQYQVLDEHYLPPNDINQQSSSHACDPLRQPTSLIVYGKTPSDTSLGFYAALNALSVKINLAEVDHPLLCEGTRRQRGELALSLLIHYKDDQERLDLILKHLLDKDVMLSTSQTTSVATTSNVPNEATTPTILPMPNNTNVINSNNKKNNNNNSQQDLNQPTEASAHFMFELAKTVFDKAGGNSTTAHIFRPQLVTQNGRGIHRRLHMCSLRIALYALGLQNRTSDKWMQRTYNGRASFIHEQAIEIGLPAIKFLCENWEGYLTPVEAALIADKAGSLNDIETKRVAAEMAKSCLKYANYLEFNAVRRIFAQCREQSIEMIEEACNEVERVAEHESVCADVLFATARAWYNLYDKLVIAENNQGVEICCQQQLKDNSLATFEQQPLPPQDNNGASNWLALTQQHQDKCQQYYNETIHPPKHWDFYGRADFIPTIFKPTYKHIEYVKSAYRVGIKALDALKPSLHTSSKHNPQKEADILWLLLLSKILGREYLHKFSLSAIENITNPHVLHAISTDLINFFESLPEDHADRMNILFPLIDKCLDRFVKRTRDLMKHISYEQKSHIDSILDEAQKLTEVANTLTAVAHFKELLRIVDNRKGKKSARIHIDTNQRHLWANDLLSYIKNCLCIKCRAGRECSVKYLT